MIVVYMLIAIVILAVLLAFTIWIYLKIRKRFSNHKILSEAFVIAIAILLSFVVKAIVAVAVMSANSESIGLGEGMATAWYVLYSTIGGVSFEGIEAVNELEGVCAVLKCVYYGSAVYVAITSLTIITVGVSYEFYSFVKIKLRLFNRVYDTLYIFTDVSEESLLMAKSIYAKEKSKAQALKEEKSKAKADKKEKCKKGKKSWKKDNFAIIFMGTELESFDRKSDVHREIVSYGFYYWPYNKSHNAEKNHCFIKRLRYTKKRCAKKDKGANRFKMVHIFSLKSDENLYAAENINSNVIFEDMQAVLRDYCVIKKGVKKDIQYDVFENNIPTVINYYVMTQSDVNYEFYKTTRINAIKRKLDEAILHKDIRGEREDELLKTFQIHILSEAQLYADDLSKQLRAEATGQRWDAVFKDEQIEAYARLLKPDSDGFYRTAVYGFGKAGQHALSELFIAASNFSDASHGGYKFPSKFIADVYDGNMSEISGEYSYNHPLFICKNCYNETSPQPNQSLYEWGKKVEGEAFAAIYNNSAYYKLSDKLSEDIINAVIKDEPDLAVESDKTEAVRKARVVYKLMGYPIIAMHESSCFEMDFMKDADNHSAGIYDKNSVKYRSFIISMGNDESNLLMANIFIDDCRHEINLTRKERICAEVTTDLNKQGKDNLSVKAKTIDAKETIKGISQDKIKFLQKKLSEAEETAVVTELDKNNLSKRVQENIPVVIFVHIRDEKNVSRLNWTKTDKENLKDDLVVVPFGCRENIWSYDNIIDDDKDSIFNYGYHLINENPLGGERKIQYKINTEYKNLFNENKTAIKNAIDQSDPELNVIKRQCSDTATALENEIMQLIREYGYYKESWLSTDAFSRESNRCVRNFAVNYRMQNPPCSDEEYSRIEHLRWMRFHMANGWIYAKYDPKGGNKGFHRHCKEHDCLIPYDMLEDGKAQNDYVNVKFARVTRSTLSDQK